MLIEATLEDRKAKVLHDLEKTLSLLGKEPSTSVVPWPTQEVFGAPRNTGITIIESVGLPAAGKTSALNYLEQSFSSDLCCIRAVIQPEFNTQLDWKTIRDEPFADLQAKSYLYELAKMHNVQEGYKRVSELIQQDTIKQQQGDPILYFHERGYNDILATQKAMFHLFPDKPELPRDSSENYKFFGVQPDYSKYFYPDTNEVLDLLGKASVGAHIPDAVLLFGVTFESAVERRGVGRLNNETVRPGLDVGYSWWLEYMYPWLHDEFGTNLLVVNGEESVEGNNEKVVDFVAEILDKKKR